MARKQPAPPPVPETEPSFALRCDLPLSVRQRLRTQAGSFDMPMSDFARRAVMEAIRLAESGQQPFPLDK